VTHLVEHPLKRLAQAVLGPRLEQHVAHTPGLAPPLLLGVGSHRQRERQHQQERSPPTKRAPCEHAERRQASPTALETSRANRQ
jgi:hypothetical protein